MKTKTHVLSLVSCMFSRVITNIVRFHLHRLTDKSEVALKNLIVKQLNYAFGSGTNTQYYWTSVIIPVAMFKFVRLTDTEIGKKIVDGSNNLVFSGRYLIFQEVQR